MEQAAQVKRHLFGGRVLKNDEFTSLHLPFPVSLVSMLTHFNKTSIQVGQPVKGVIIIL